MTLFFPQQQRPTCEQALIDSSGRPIEASGQKKRNINYGRCAAVALEFVSQQEYRNVLLRNDSYPYPLAVIGYGEFGVSELPENIFTVPLPVLGNDACFEIWRSEDPVSLGHSGNIRYAQTTGVLFGTLTVAESGTVTLQQTARNAYEEIFDFLKDYDGCQILRVWNYFSEINIRSGGLERYAEFCSGRHDAFASHALDIAARAPAACALGCQSGPLHIYFVAALTAGRQIENPRQMPAYRYPERYGPRSPSFARATLARMGSYDHLFISGTASVVGHETLHVGDVRAQCLETIANLEALAVHCGWPGGRRLETIESATYKVYLRHVEDFPVVRSLLKQYLNPKSQAMYLKADICRSDLLVEIEGMWSVRVL